MRRKFLRFALGASLMSMAISVCGFTSKAEDVEVQDEVVDVVSDAEQEDVTAEDIAVGPNSWVVKGDKYYYLDENVEYVTSTWKNIKGYDYYFNDEGVNVRGEHFWADGATYRTDANGHKIIGWYDDNPGGDYPVLFYYDTTGKGADGATTIDGVTYCFNYGYMLVNQPYYKDGKLYAINDKGVVIEGPVAAHEGWNIINSQWCYVKDENIYYGWIKDNGYYYHFSTGYMDTNTVVIENDNLYYLNKAGKMLTGWFYVDDCWFYADATGKIATGLKTIDGSTYLFREWGAMTSDMVTEYNNTIYNTATSGKVIGSAPKKNGWLKLGSDWAYVESGEVKYDYLLKSNGAWYYMDYNGKMACNKEVYYYDAELGTYLTYNAAADGKIKTGWSKTTWGAWNYIVPSTLEYAKDGAYVIGKDTYVFDEYGNMLSDGVFMIDGVVYNTATSGKVLGSAPYKDGWIKLGSEYAYGRDGDLVHYELIKDGAYWYFIGDDSLMLRDRESTYYWDEANQKSYDLSIDASGRIITGWIRMYSRWHYLDQATLEYYSDGCYAIDGKYYTFDYDGNLELNTTFNQNGKVYHVYADGTCEVYSDTRTGWVANKYYIENKKAVTGWKKINNKWYYFDDAGAKCVGMVNVNGGMYYFDSTGAMVSNGWYKITDNGVMEWIYANADGLLAEGKQRIDKKDYYFVDGVMQTGLVFDGDKAYIYDNNGVCIGEQPKKENQFVTVSGKTYYLMTNGEYAGMNEAFNTINGKLYYFDYSGVMAKDCIIDEYYFGTDGAALKNAWHEFAPGVRSYYEADGKRFETGWKQIADKWYYFEDGIARIGDVIIGNKLYHFDGKGVWDNKTVNVANGWYLLNGQWHYAVNGVDVEGWKKINNDWYYFFDGIMVSDSHIYDNDDIYAFDENGKMVKNAWIHEGADQWGSWLYAGADGKCLRGLQTINGKQYYFYDVMRTDNALSQDEKALYEINDNGVVTKIVKPTKDGWLKASDGTWYYVKNGKFVTEPININGNLYMFDYDGKLLTDEIYDDYGYANKDGIVIKQDGWVKRPDGSWLYLVDGKIVEGAYSYNGQYYYGGYYSSTLWCVAQVDGKIYDYRGEEGIRNELKFKEGWNEYSGMWFYVQNGVLAKGWKMIDNKWCFFDEVTSALATNAVVYSFEDVMLAPGAHATDANGYLIVNGWFDGWGSWMYFGADGVMVTGKQTINGKTYQFDGAGIMY